MPEVRLTGAATLKPGEKKLVKAGDTEILLIQLDGSLVAVQPKCPHAGAPLEQGAICNNRLVCPWHMGVFALPTGDLLEPPPLIGLDTYAVRVEGADVLLDTKPKQHRLPEPHQASNSRTFLLVGAGAAGIMAAITLRNEGFEGHIVAVDPHPDEPIDRTQLSKQVLAGKMPLEKTRLDSLEHFGVERIVASVTNFSTNPPEAHLSNGATVSFNAAFIATGGVPKRLDLPGAERAFTLRHSDDVKAILDVASPGKHAAVIGTSFIGLEAASALTQKGLRVTVIGKEKDLPFASKFGDRVANAIVGLHEKNGVQFRIATETLALTGQGVTLQTDSKPQEQLAADLVLFGVGVSPTLSFEHDLPPAEKGGGVAVDDTLRAADGVFVGGDIASVNGTRIEHWRLAEQHGALAARNMLGFQQHYTGVPFFWTFHFGKRFGYLGHATEWDEIIYDGDVEALTFLAFYIKDGIVAAVLSCGRDHDTASLAEPMRNRSTLADLRASL